MVAAEGHVGLFGHCGSNAVQYAFSSLSILSAVIHSTVPSAELCMAPSTARSSPKRSATLTGFDLWVLDPPDLFWSVLLGRLGAVRGEVGRPYCLGRGIIRWLEAALVASEAVAEAAVWPLHQGRTVAAARGKHREHQQRE